MRAALALVAVVASTGSLPKAGMLVPGHSLGGVKSGAVYAFRRSGTIWSEIDRIVPDDPVISSWFGSAVALEGLGAVAVVGARHHRHDPYPAPASGAAYVFFRSDAHWSEEAELLPGDPHDEMEFGSSVAASFFGNRVIAGAPGMTGSDVRGAAYVFGLSASEWPQVAKLTSGAGEMRPGFATGVTMAGDGSFAVAGDPGSLDATGACFGFREAGGSWSRAGGWSPPRAALSTWAELGRSVAMAGTEIVAGAPGDDTAGADAGAVYVSGELLFADGFEGGDCSRWASVSD